MTCRSCGATIAPKAIVCYRCGTPTEDHAEVPREPLTRAKRTVAPLLIIGVGAVLAGAWLIPMTPEGTWMRYAAWAAVPAVVFAASRLVPGRRSSRLRRR